jgi:hypothetical protein
VGHLHCSLIFTLQRTRQSGGLPKRFPVEMPAQKVSAMKNLLLIPSFFHLKNSSDNANM